MGATPLPTTTGLMLVVCGQSIRTVAMWTAGSNFTHIIADRKSQTHKLVTHGIYRSVTLHWHGEASAVMHCPCALCHKAPNPRSLLRRPESDGTVPSPRLVPCSFSRHPSYMGWFWWSIGTQLLLCNPIVCARVCAHARLMRFAPYGHPTACIRAHCSTRPPQATVGYAAASWQFFADRIPYEEETLHDFFGAEYAEYCRRVPTRIPFIS